MLFLFTDDFEHQSKILYDQKPLRGTNQSCTKMYILSKAWYLKMLSARNIQQKEIKVKVNMKASNKVLC